MALDRWDRWDRWDRKSTPMDTAGSGWTRSGAESWSPLQRIVDLERFGAALLITSECGSGKVGIQQRETRSPQNLEEKKTSKQSKQADKQSKKNALGLGCWKGVFFGVPRVLGAQKDLCRGDGSAWQPGGPFEQGPQLLLPGGKYSVRPTELHGEKVHTSRKRPGLQNVKTSKPKVSPHPSPTMGTPSGTSQAPLKSKLGGGIHPKRSRSPKNRKPNMGGEFSPIRYNGFEHRGIEISPCWRWSSWRRAWWKPGFRRTGAERSGRKKGPEWLECGHGRVGKGSLKLGDLFSPTAESFGVSAQIGSGVVRGAPEVRFH